MTAKGTVEVWVGAALTALLVGAGALTALRAQGAPVKPDAARTTVAEFTPLQACGGALVVDVRSEQSYKDGHIPGAISVPIDEIQSRAVMIVDRAGSRPIVTYCSCPSEHTSALAAGMLRDAGARHVSALIGGYPAWVESGGKVDR